MQSAAVDFKMFFLLLKMQKLGYEYKWQNAMLEANVKVSLCGGAKFHSIMVRNYTDTVQCKEAEFVWSPYCSMED